MEDIRKVQSLCRDNDDEMRWLIALISDTGMRLGEAAGLLKKDIKLDDRIPHIDLRPHPWRSLKTKGSRRVIPLTKEALWASERLLEANDDSIFAFPRYCDETGCKANSAMRNTGCPFDIQDRFGGWYTPGVGSSYGQGYNIETLHHWMSMLVVDSGD